MIGLLSAQGKAGMRSDPVLAYAWLSLAVDGGETRARLNRDTVGRVLNSAQKARSAQLQEELRAKTAVEPEPGAAPAR